jgi:hypothetical protein
MKKVLLLALLCGAPPTAAALGQTFSLVATGGQSLKTWHGQADAQSLSFEWTRSHSKRTELGVAIAPHFLRQPRSWFGDRFGDGDENVRALSASFVARHHFGNRSVRPYVELLIGPMWGEKQVPASTSRFNFITQPGFGLTFARRGRIAPTVGYRFSHVSNGGYSPRNPGINVNSVVAGLRFTSNSR